MGVRFLLERRGAGWGKNIPLETRRSEKGLRERLFSSARENSINADLGFVWVVAKKNQKLGEGFGRGGSCRKETIDGPPLLTPGSKNCLMEGRRKENEKENRPKKEGGKLSSKPPEHWGLTLWEVSSSTSSEEPFAGSDRRRRGRMKTESGAPCWKTGTFLQTGGKRVQSQLLDEGENRRRTVVGESFWQLDYRGLRR